MENDDLPWSPSPDAPFLVADWTVDAPANRLLRDGDEVRLEPKVMSVLVYLARHRGQVVSRNDLESGVWTGMVVGYDAVTNAVIKLRRALGDDSRAPRIIETISKQGYRLIADVGPVDEPVIGQSPAPESRRPGDSQTLAERGETPPPRACADGRSAGPVAGGLVDRCLRLSVAAGCHGAGVGVVAARLDRRAAVRQSDR